MHLVFYRTSDVFEAEEILQSHNIVTDIVPTPVQDKAYCGVCVKIAETDLNLAIDYLQQLEYQKVL
jgi:hypothetical protein